MTPVDALELALSKEIQSIELYEKFSIKHSQLRDIFTFLIGEEQKHKKLIEKEIQKITKY